MAGSITQKTEALLAELLSDYQIILGSHSPRRKELLRQLGLPFRVNALSVVEEFPKNLKGAAITDYLARLKADSLKARLKENEILITADTIVWHEDKLLGKPENPEEAIAMLSNLSDDWHEVITSICCSTAQNQRVVHETTLVKFRELRPEEIKHYVSTFLPFDKAGAYGIQEWIGMVGISEISGSYTNVVGLPTASLYEVLRTMVS